MMVQSRLLRFMLSVVLLGPALFAAEPTASFAEVLNKHLAAVRQQDFDAFAATLPDSGPFTLILANGSKTDSVDKVKEMHREWFAAGGWTMRHEILTQNAGERFAHALVKADYREADRNGSPYEVQIYVNMVFEKTKKGWVLIHDQCTNLPKSDAKP